MSKKVKWALAVSVLLILSPWLYILLIGPAYHLSHLYGTERQFWMAYGPICAYARKPRTYFGDPLEAYLKFCGVPFRNPPFFP